MYTDDDLNLAVENNVFTESSVNEFRTFIDSIKETHSADEEKFKLITSFNDVFVVIACFLLLLSVAFLFGIIDGGRGYGVTSGSLVFSGISWCLAEVFVLKRRMALPAIFLLLTFSGGVFSSFYSFFLTIADIPVFDISAGFPIIMATAGTAIFSFFHWLRFKVPITVAAATISVLALFLSIILYAFAGAKDWLYLISFLFGVMSFLFAMHWDSADINRVTYKADVAFWLHLLSAPLIIHPVFSGLGILDGNNDFSSMFIVIFLYLLMSLISIVIDRRAFMVSSLIYVIYALYGIFSILGNVAVSLALTGIFIGTILLSVSAFWHQIRSTLINKSPDFIKVRVPMLKTNKA